MVLKLQVVQCNVEEEVDSGSLIMQAALPISNEDNVETLSKKIQILEHIILPHSISHAGYLIRGDLGKVIS